MKTPKFLKSRRTIIAIGCILVIALVWLVFGLLIPLGMLICFIGTCVVLVFFILYLVLSEAFQKKQSDQLEKSLWEQSEEQKMAMRPEKRDEIEALRQQLSGSIQKLKLSKLGNGRRGSSALYALPWYMIIGPPAAGKTTAIRNSGLEFPFGTDHEIQGVGGTRNCDWWFSSSAIILDTAGRYTTEEDDREEWIAFLDILKRNRKRQPINGVLVCISIADLIDARKDDLDKHARTIRKRVDELIQQLRVRFPVYLIFTKCDLVNGFVEFFEDFSRTQRDQVWGCTLTAEQQMDSRPRAVFEAEFQTLFESLVDMRLARLSPGIKRESRSRIFAYPMEFLSVKENLSYFVGSLFQLNPYQESPMFRGFYFTSGTQEGVPIDKVLASIKEAFGLDEESTPDIEMQTKSYFIKDLFTSIVIPDDKLVRPSSRSGKNLRLARLGIVSAIVITLVLFVFGVTRAFFVSKDVINEAARDMELIRNSKLSTERLDIMLKRIQSLQDSPLFAFGMDQSNNLREVFERLYFEQLEKNIQSEFYDPLKQGLRDRSRKQGELQDDLKAFLLLTTEYMRLDEDPTNGDFLMKQIEKTVGQQRQEKMAPHFEFFSKEYYSAVENGKIARFEGDDALVKEARSRAGSFDIAGMYATFKQKLGTLPAYTIPSTLFESKTEVRGIFTMQGYESFRERIKDLGGLDKEARWVLGYQDDQIQGLLGNQAEIADSLEKMYLREYADEWWSFLLNIRVVPAQNLADATYQMKTLSDPQNSLIRKLFDDVLLNTRFEKSTVEALGEKAGKTVGLKQDINTVVLQFKSLHQFVASDPEKGIQSKLDGLISQLGDVSDQMDRLVDSPPRDARKGAEEVLSGGGSLRQLARQVEGSLKDRDDRTRRTVNSIFMEPVRSVWKALLTRTAEYLNEEWRSQVVEPYRRLANGFPLNTSSQANIPPNELADLFADGGMLSKFIEKELRPFFEGDDLREAKKWEGRGLGLATAAKNGLAEAKWLRQSLFNGHDVALKVNMTIEPPSPRKDVDIVYFEVGEKREKLEIDQWKKSLSFEWLGSGVASIRLVEEGGWLSSDDDIDKLSFDGEWGLFRLINAGRKSSTSSAVLCKWTFKDNITLAATIRTDKGSLNPFGRSLSVNLPNTLF